MRLFSLYQNETTPLTTPKAVWRKWRSGKIWDAATKTWKAKSEFDDVAATQIDLTDAWDAKANCWDIDLPEGMKLEEPEDLLIYNNGSTTAVYAGFRVFPDERTLERYV